MIKWIEPYDEAKRRAELIRLPLIPSVVIGLLQCLGIGICYAILGYLFYDDFDLGALIILCGAAAILVSFCHHRSNVVQQKIKIDGVSRKIEIIGDNKPHVLNVSDLRGYSINVNETCRYLCLFLDEGLGWYSVIFPTNDSSYEKDIHKIFHDVPYVSFLDVSI
ncbi:hypothetical protein [Photobacterium sanguinicancri]|uniref:hypothetical protein n=1 Tax=Photobacterium sanguinicancri TaxID=875932 RepID=UPI003D12C50C